jgi:L-ascorbate metabolism protein UlaG (beta-lactamase superfamily)
MILRAFFQTAVAYPRSDHFDGERFFNPTGGNGRSFADVPKMASEPRIPWPRSIPVQQRPPEPRPPMAWATITFIGHATFFIQTPCGNVLTDPMFSDRASPFSRIGPRRVRQPGVALSDFPGVDLVLLSHNHYDHCDLPSLRAIRRRYDPHVVTPLGTGRLLRKAGYRRYEELDWWQQSALSSLPVTATPAQHFSARTPWDRNRALWCGFVLMVGDRRIFFAGDSGYAPHFSDVPRRCGPIDMALLPIGAYEPRWFMREVHMNPEEAVQAHTDLQAGTSLGMHFGTFRLTAEGIDDPLTALETSRNRRGIPPDRFFTIDFGASIHLDDRTV